MQQTGAYAEFTDRDSASEAVSRLERSGVPRSRILIDEHAPDQSSTPIDTEVRDKRTMTSLWTLGSRGLVLGLIGGAIFGAVLGSLVWSPMSPAWILLAVGLGVFGAGLGLLWSFLIGKGEGTHMGTVYDEPAADQPTRITVRSDDPAEVERYLETLEAAGGRHLRRVPEEADKPER
jgi:hypothetical protein